MLGVRATTAVKVGTMRPQRLTISHITIQYKRARDGIGNRNGFVPTGILFRFIYLSSQSKRGDRGSSRQCTPGHLPRKNLRSNALLAVSGGQAPASNPVSR